MATNIELVSAIVNAIDRKRGSSIEVLHTAEVTTLAEYFIMATAHSTTQLRTLSDECQAAAEKIGEPPYSVEGERESGWMALDFSSVIVHLFLPDQREFYALDRLWRDAESVDVEQFLPKEEK